MRGSSVNVGLLSQFNLIKWIIQIAFHVIKGSSFLACNENIENKKIKKEYNKRGTANKELPKKGTMKKSVFQKKTGLKWERVKYLRWQHGKHVVLCNIGSVAAGTTKK